MVTFKQLEAIYWVTRLGGFAAAAQQLHTSQSAISKRIRELELQFDTELFDRSLRSARLTERGEEMFRLAQNLLARRDEAVEQFSHASQLESKLRIGVTELIAMTWLPSLIRAIQEEFPRVVIESDIDTSIALTEKLRQDALDLTIVPDVFDDEDMAHLAMTPIAKVDLGWMCKPGTLAQAKPLRLNELATHRLLIQGKTAGTGLIYKRWLRNNGVQPMNLIVCNNLLGRIALTISGLGVSYLPLSCMQPLVQAGLLEAVNVTPALPPMSYVACHKRERHGGLVSAILQLAQESCDFSNIVGLKSKTPTLCGLA